MKKRTTATNKQWDSYADYLKSPEWKEIKERFKATYEGDLNTCEVTGRIFSDKSKKLLHFHHFKYPNDWNNDSPKNLILISKDVHDFIHADKRLHKRILEPEAKENGTIYRAALLFDYAVFQRNKAIIDANMFFKKALDQIKGKQEVSKLKMLEQSLELALEKIDSLKEVSK